MSDAYTVLARRYRSQTFDELVGQEAIAQTLKNAIKSNRVAHAFLFTGTRGVGKTSAARILAKAINCPNRTKDGNPCGECNACKATARGEDIDVIEIDGASNNSVDQIRELRQSAGIRPARSPYKIYIIDEVHMLTGGAFNALLKTLEEPPEHVKFIFATTEIHKVPATIISRCQRFDFKNIPTPKIVEHLTALIKAEGIQADQDALYRVARLGNGSMRDALSILDRVLSLGEKHITDKSLETLLGKPPTAAIAELMTAIADSDPAGAIKHADGLLQEGLGVEQVLSEVIDFLRNLMIVAACGAKTELLDVPADARGAYTGLAAKFDAPTLVHLIALCDATLRSLKASTMHRPLFDALIVRLALSEQFSSIKDLIRDTASDDSAADAAKKKSDVNPAPHDPALRGNARPTAHAPVSLAAPTSTPLPPESTPSAPPSPESEPEENIYEVMKGHMRRKQEEIEARNAQQKPMNASPIGTTPYARPGPQGARPIPAAAPRPVEKVADVTNLGDVWAATRNYLSACARLLENVLGPISKITSLNRGTSQATLLVPISQQNFTNDKARAKIEEAVRAVTGLPLKLLVEFVDAPPPTPGGPGYLGNMPSIASQRVPPEVMEAVKKQPVVQELMKRLDATITQVELTDSGDGE